MARDRAQQPAKRIFSDRFVKRRMAHTGADCQKFGVPRYFVEAGFNVVAIEGMPVDRSQAERLSSEETYGHIKKIFLKHPGADGIYLQGSGTWRPTDVLPLEEDLNIPVIHPVAARVW